METNQKDEFSEIGSMQDVLTGVSSDPSSANGHGSGRRRCHGRCKHSHQRKDSSDEEPINKLSWHLRSLWIVIPFFLLFLLKEAVAHSKGFWVIISLFVSSFYINSRVSKAALGFESPTYALFASSWTFVSVAFLHYVPYLRDDAIYLGLICVPNLIPASDWVSLLWAVIVVDFSLRILTIFVKSFVIYLTSRRVIEFSQQSAILVWVEFVSQVYRNIPPAVTWVRHLTTASDRHSFAFLVFLTVLYLFLKVVALGLLSSSMWPVFKYDAFSQPYQTVTVAPESEVDGSSPQFCAMCLNRLSPNVAILGCNHRYCKPCVDRWLARFDHCPECSHPLGSELRTWRDGFTSALIYFY